MGTGASTKSNAIEKVLFDDAIAEENSKKSEKYLEDNTFLEKMNLAGIRRARVEKQGKALVGALAARQKIIKKAAELKAKRRSALALTDLNKFLLNNDQAEELGPNHSPPNSPPTSPLMGYGRRKKDDSIAAKKSAIRLKRIENKGKGSGKFVLAPQIEHVFTELKNGPSQRKRRRIKTSEDGKTILPMSPLAPVMAFSTSSSIVVRWADHPKERALIEFYEIQWSKKGKMLHWESLAAVRHAAKSATIGNLPCYCTPMRFRVRAKSTFGWGPWSQISEYMQTSPNRPARPSRITSGKVTKDTIEIKWPIPEDNGSKIIHYTLYACEKGSTFKNAYRGVQNKFILGTAPKSNSPKKKTFANKFKDKKTKQEEDDDSSDDEENGGIRKSVKIDVKPGYTYLVKIIATNKIGDSVSSEVISFKSLEGGVDAMEETKRINDNKTRRGGTSKVEHQEAAESIMASWLHHSREVNNNNNNTTTNGTWESKWKDDMPTGPTRIAQLSNGWVECWDPASERIYYHNPATNHTQWEYPSESIHDDQLRNGGRENVNSNISNNNNRKKQTIALPDKDAPFRQKRFRFLWHIRGKPNAKCKMLPVKVSRDNLVYLSFQALAHTSPENLKKKLRITYDGEVGIDSGGITKDWFLEMSRALLDPRYVLFQKNDHNGRYAVDSRSGVNGQHLEYFNFFGRLLGKAIYDRHLLDVHLSLVLYKHLLGIKPNINDLKDIDPVYFESLQWVMNNNIDGCDVLENFSVTRQKFGELNEIELIPNGKNIPVTNKNKHEYVEALVAYECGLSTKEQLDAIREGFYTLIPEESVKVFTVEELELLINGKEDVDVDEMQSGSVYNGGYDVDSKPVALFWQAMKQWSVQERGNILRFITGTSRVPLDGFDPVFTITKASDGGTSALPSAHTCFNQLVLPEYESLEQLIEKMKFAVTEGSKGFHLT